MTQGDEIHNENISNGGGNVFQVGAVHGNVVLLPQPSARLSADELDTKTARDLANEVRRLSTQEMQHWGISSSGALSVRWHTASEDLLDHWENIHGTPDHNDPISLTGHFTVIRDTYQAIHSKRLVILGQAGAGKTVLAHRLILDLLKTAAHTGPVPVLFSLSDWNPTSTTLRTWLIQQLLRDFPFLDDHDPTTRKRKADCLVDKELILPILDGFDEIPNRHHRAAINKISNVDWPLVVTSRPDEYTQAAQAVKAVGRAAAIELEDLPLDEAHRFLRLNTSKSRSPEWDAVFNYLRTAPDEPTSQTLTLVLTTPLMVMLAHTIYNDTPDHHPSELLDTQRFPTRADLEEHLLGVYLDTLYHRRDPSPRRARRPNWDPDQARHWLGYLATHLTQRNTHDLTWWQLPTTLHRYTRILITMTVSVIAIRLAIGFEAGLMDGIAYGLMDGLERGIEGVFKGGFGLALGLAVGLAVGLLNEVRFGRGRTGHEPERVRLGLRRRNSSATRSSRTYLKDVAVEVTSGLVLGLALEFADVLTVGLSSSVITDVLTYVFSFALSFGLANIIVSALGERHPLREAIKPWQLLSTDRTVTLVRTIAAALTIMLAIVLINRLTDTIQLPWVPIFGLMGAMVRLMLSAWGNWLLFARLWLPLTRRLPWRPKRFLQDAHQRGVLRQAGAVYQFRHARLRDHLADHYQTKP